MKRTNIQILKDMVRKLIATPLFQKGKVADDTLSQAVVVLEDHDSRISQLGDLLKGDQEVVSQQFEHIAASIDRIESLIREKEGEGAE
ncbi:MAG: hypothetical protein KME67_03960 [Candidatus Thiodiazotropha sp. (ex Codakia orbicularis)]|nr:hypothetical protein [Candidatus Thiodiazotropha sp. (ex Codakia orbicularis)]